MNKILLVLRNEIITTLTRRSFLLGALGVPVLLLLIVLIAWALIGSAPGAGAAATVETPELKAEGYVDQSGLVKTIPEDLPPGTLSPYPDEAAARRALDAGEITAFYVISEDYVESGELIYICPDYNVLSPSKQSWVMRWALLVNLLDGDVDLAAQVMQPLDVEVRAQTADPPGEEENEAARWLPYGTALVLYMVLVLASSLLTTSVHREKKNRLMEILMSSITPQQLLTGKIVGLGITGLMMAVVWGLCGYTVLRLGGQTFAFLAGLELPLPALVGSIVFFLLGYGVYASLMAGLGALVPNMRDATQGNLLIMAPLIVALILASPLSDYPHGGLAIGLSLFPLTAPVTMTQRLASGGVPLWQPILSAALLLATAMLVMRAVGRMFHAQTLLSGQPFSLKRYLSALRGRE